MRTNASGVSWTDNPGDHHIVTEIAKLTASATLLVACVVDTRVTPPSTREEPNRHARIQKHAGQGRTGRVAIESVRLLAVSFGSMRPLERT